MKVELKNERGWPRVCVPSPGREMFDPARKVDMIGSNKDRRRSDGHRQDRNRVTSRWTCSLICVRRDEIVIVVDRKRGKKKKKGREESSTAER